MLRRLLLALLAAGLGFFAAALLRAERRMGRAEQAPPPAASCTGRTRDGGRCSRPPQPGSDRCWQHQR